MTKGAEFYPGKTQPHGTAFSSGVGLPANEYRFFSLGR